MIAVLDRFHILQLRRNRLAESKSACPRTVRSHRNSSLCFVFFFSSGFLRPQMNKVVESVLLMLTLI